MAVIKLRDIPQKTRYQSIWRSTGVGKYYNWSLLSDIYWNLYDAGIQLRMPSRDLQILRFSSRLWQQVAGNFRGRFIEGENRSDLTEDIVNGLGEEVLAFAQGYSLESATLCYQALCRALFIVKTGILPIDPPSRNYPARLSLRSKFVAETDQFIAEFFDDGKREILDAFLGEWRQIAIAHQDPYILVYLMILEDYRRYLLFLQDHRDITIENDQVNEIKKRTRLFALALSKDDTLGQYQAISHLITILQRAKGEPREDYVCR